MYNIQFNFSVLFLGEHLRVLELKFKYRTRVKNIAEKLQKKQQNKICDLITFL